MIHALSVYELAQLLQEASEAYGLAFTKPGAPDRHTWMARWIAKTMAERSTQGPATSDNRGGLD